MLSKNNHRKEVKAEQQQIRALTTGGSESLSLTDIPLFKLRLGRWIARQSICGGRMLLPYIVLLRRSSMNHSHDNKVMPLRPWDLHRLADFFESALPPFGHGLIIRRLYWMTNHIEKCYYPAAVPKRNGGSRMLDVPYPDLKACQRRILEELLPAFPVHPCAKAYVKGANLRDAAAPHVGKPLVVKLDIHDFYGSIRFRTVYERVFGEDRFPRKVGMILANLCCCRGVLPQGAPTSPAISNIVMRPLDEAVDAFCRQRAITYTRYSDDLIFSGSGFEPTELIRYVKTLLSRDGFTLNNGKTQIIRQGQRQVVTGVVVNEKAQLPAGYRRRIRQEVYFCRKYGVRDHIIRSGQGEYIRFDAASEDNLRIQQQKYLLHLLGQIGYALLIDPENQEMQRCRKTVKGFLTDLRAVREKDRERKGLREE